MFMVILQNDIIHIMNTGNMTIEEALAIIKKLQNDNDDLKSQYNHLNQEYKELEKENVILSQERNLLEKENNELRFRLRDANEELEKLILKYNLKVENYNKQVAEKYGASSEKIKDEDCVINEVEIEAQEKKPRKKKGSGFHTFVNELKEVAVKTIIKDYDFKVNNINKEDAKYIGSDVTYKLEAIPVEFEVVRIERPKYSYNGSIIMAINDDVFNNSPLTPSLASSIIDKKYSLGIPINRYSDYLKANGYDISKQVISNWIIKCSDLLTPLYNQMVNDLVNNDVKIIHSDESTIDVIENKVEAKNNNVKNYFYCLTTSDFDLPIRIYSYGSGSRSSENIKKILKDYKGYLICDGFSGYDSLRDELSNIKLQRCFVHAERYFKDVLKPLSNKQRKESKAHEVIVKMNRINSKEKYIRTNLRDPEEIVKYRHSEEYSKLIKDLDDYIDSIEPIPGSLFDKAINYYKNHYDELYTYLNYGYLINHNNKAEQTVRTVCVHRKAWLFSNTNKGANASMILYSITQTAKANGLIVEKYLKYLFENLNKIPIQELLPYYTNLPIDIQIKK